MAIGLLIEGAGMTEEQYAAVRQAVSPTNRPPAGLLYHAAGPVADGFRVMEVWESQEALDAFFGAALGRALGEARVTAQPQIFPIQSIMQP